MKYFVLIILTLFTMSCASKPIAVHKEQLLLKVPQELLVEPKGLETL
jgi:hypothetical protein